MTMISAFIKNFTLLILFAVCSFIAQGAVITNEKKPIYFFVNHDLQLMKLRDKLLKTGKVGITGITGKGKSELAKRYVEQFKDKYAIIAFFNTDIDLTPQYIDLAKDINNSICQNENCSVSTHPAKVKESITSFLNGRNDWLLIFDNVQLNQNNKIKDIL